MLQSSDFSNNLCKTLCSCCYIITKRQFKCSKKLSEGFNISVCWNKYKVIDNISANVTVDNEEKHPRDTLDSTYQRVKDCLFWLMIIQWVIINVLLILIKHIYFQK